MLAQRLQRWAKVKTKLIQRLVVAGNSLSDKQQGCESRLRSVSSSQNADHRSRTLNRP